MTDRDWMALNLELAARGRGAVEPNPMVGAVVVRDGRLVGEGWHRRYGEAHAEVNALAAAGDAARGADLYVTLEPCCHHGKTPPCTDAVIRAGVRRVVAAMADPFPQVAGRGVEMLRAAGITVEIGIAEAEARRLNAPYLKLLATGRPWVIAKWAMTLDGKIATAIGHSQWISGEESRRRVHELRGRVDAVIVGGGTVRTDDPLLTARLPGPRTAVRVVVSASADLPDDCKLLQSVDQAPVIVMTAEPNVGKLARWRDRGCEVIGLPDLAGRANVAVLLDELGRRRMTNVLVEGGSGLLGSFLDARAIDEVWAFVAPVLVGGRTALTPIGGDGSTTIPEGLRLAECESERSGEDWLIRGRLPDWNRKHS